MLYYMATIGPDDLIYGRENLVPCDANGKQLTAELTALYWLDTFPHGSIRIYRKVSRSV